MCRRLRLTGSLPAVFGALPQYPRIKNCVKSKKYEVYIPNPSHELVWLAVHSRPSAVNRRAACNSARGRVSPISMHG